VGIQKRLVYNSRTTKKAHNELRGYFLNDAVQAVPPFFCGANCARRENFLTRLPSRASHGSAWVLCRRGASALEY
jgi:hypothetical protein